MMTAYTSGVAGDLAATAKGVSIYKKGVLVTFFGKNRDGKGDLIRLWEQNGKTGSCTVSLPVGSKYKVA